MTCFSSVDSTYFAFLYMSLCFSLSMHLTPHNHFDTISLPFPKHSSCFKAHMEFTMFFSFFSKTCCLCCAFLPLWSPWWHADLSPLQLWLIYEWIFTSCGQLASSFQFLELLNVNRLHLYSTSTILSTVTPCYHVDSLILEIWSLMTLIYDGNFPSFLLSLSLQHYLSLPICQASQFVNFLLTSFLSVPALNCCWSS